MSKLLRIPSAEPPRASGIFGRWFGRGEEAPAAGRRNAAEPAPPKRSWLSRLTSGLSRSSSAIGRGIVDIFTKRKLDETSLDDLEDILIQADLGIGPATRLREAIGKGRYEKGIDPDEVKRLLAEEVERTLAPVAKPLVIDAAKKPFVILVIGVNGSGKTTTIGKLAAKFAADGPQGAARRRRHVPRRGDRATCASGRRAPRPRSSRASRAATRRASPSTR